jgi:Transposase DDE domain
MEGSRLEDLVALSVSLCQKTERAFPRRGPGRKPTIPDWVLAVMIMVAVMLKKKTKAAQLLWWTERPTEFVRWMPGQQLPSRSTFYERYQRVHWLFRQAILLQGREAIKRGWANGEAVAVDKSLIAGRGRKWNAPDRRRGRVPRGVDTDTTWGYSDHDGWVQGYAYEVVVTATRHGVVWPLAASVDTASRSEQKTIVEKVPDLPRATKFVLADSGYDSNAVAETVEWEGQHRTGRRFLCPEVPRPQTKRQRQPHNRETRERQHHRRLRDERRRFLRSRRGRALYRRRNVSVEPFNARLKHMFDLNDRVWHWGLPNNRTMLLAAVCIYQLLLMHNGSKRRPMSNLQCLLDAL